MVDRGIHDAETNRKPERPGARIAVRWLPVGTLKPEKRNARIHSAKQIARIADSIKAFGFNVPVLLDKKGGVLAGHGRLLAAKRLGLEEVPTITLAHLNETGRRAFMIADNRLAELASWDDRRLGLELEELKSLDLDFTIEATGFEMSEIDLRIEAERAPGRRKPESQERPAPKGPAVARAGETWSLGPHRLCCGDAGDPAACRAVDAAIRRWQALTGESARLHPTGVTFDAAARSRRPRKGGHAESAAE